MKKPNRPRIARRADEGYDKGKYLDLRLDAKHKAYDETIAILIEFGNRLV